MTPFLAGPSPLTCPTCGGLEEIAVRKPGVPEAAWPSRICTDCIGGVVRCGVCGDRPAAEVVERERLCVTCLVELAASEASGGSGEVMDAGESDYAGASKNLHDRVA